MPEMSASPDPGVALCRSRFPRGLEQPPGSLRFGVDALLLAAFACAQLAERASGGGCNVCELGCGCGAALFAVLLQMKGARGLGIDIAPQLVGVALANRRKLGLEEMAQFRLGDARQPEFWPDWPAGSCHLVMANPPWLATRAGRPSAHALRELALVGGPGILAAFCRCAGKFMAPEGKLCLILPWRSLALFRSVCAECGLAPRRIMPVRAFGDAEPGRFLAMAEKGSCGELVWSEPLTLHERGFGASTAKVTPTEASLRFCPWLGTTSIPVSGER